MEFFLLEMVKVDSLMMLFLGVGVVGVVFWVKVVLLRREISRGKLVW